MNLLDAYDDDSLTAIARKKRPRLQRWISNSGNRNCRDYICNICGELIDSESGRHRETKHAEDAIRNHRDKHLAEIGELGASIEKPLPLFANK